MKTLMNRCGNQTEGKKLSAVGALLTLGLVASLGNAQADPAVVGKYQDGYALGLRNGGLIVERLKARTINTNGCSSLDTYQNGLLAVTRGVRPPLVGPGGEPSVREYSQGFFRGYLEAVRQGLQKARTDCKKKTYRHGGPVGEIYGSLLCQVTKVDVSLVSDLEIVPLYDRWAGNNSSTKTVIGQCVKEATLIIEQCGTNVGTFEKQIGLAIELGCANNT